MASVAFTQGYQAYCNDDPPVPPPGLSHAQRHAWSEGVGSSRRRFDLGHLV